MPKNSRRKGGVTEDFVVTITLGSDGRILFHDLTADVLPIACAICPDNEGLKKRQELARKLVKK